MPESKWLARIIAALFVITMAMGMVDAYLAAPILRGPLEDIHSQESTVLLGAAMRLLMSIGVAGIAIAFLPIVRRYNETVAFSYLAARTAECVLLCMGVCTHVFLIGLSRSYVEAGSPADSTATVLAQGALGFSRTTYQMAMTILGLAATQQTWTLLRTRLLPVWVAGLGCIGYALLFASALLDLVGAVDTLEGAGALMYIPGGVFELVILPAWLGIRGFNTPDLSASTQASG